MPLLLIKFLPYVIGAMLIVSGYFGWKHHIETAVRNEVLAEIAARDAETERKSKELLKLKQHEADLINQRNQARANNASLFMITLLRCYPVNAEIRITNCIMVNSYYICSLQLAQKFLILILNGIIVTGKQIGRASCRERVCQYV